MRNSKEANIAGEREEQQELRWLERLGAGAAEALQLIQLWILF